MAVSRDCDCSPPSNTWDSFTLVGHSDGATNTRPPQEGERGEEKKEDEWSQGSAMIQCQCPERHSGWCIRDHHLSCGEPRPDRFYCFIMSSERKSLIIQTNAGSVLWSFWVKLLSHHMKKLEHFTGSVMKSNTSGINERKKEESWRCIRGTVWWLCCLTALCRWLFKQTRAEMSPALCREKACWQPV